MMQASESTDPSIWVTLTGRTKGVVEAFFRLANDFGVQCRRDPSLKMIHAVSISQSEYTSFAWLLSARLQGSRRALPAIPAVVVGFLVTPSLADLITADGHPRHVKICVCQD